MQSANPFLSLVGLRGVTVAPTVRQWVNDTPGISSELVAALPQASDSWGKTNDSDEIATMWEKVHRAAWTRLVQEVTLNLAEQVDYQPVVADLTLASALEPSSLVGPNPMLRGLQLNVPFVANTALNLRSVSFLAETTTDNVQARVLVYSITTNNGDPIFDEVLPIEPGFNEIPLNLSVTARLLRPLSLLVLIDTSQLRLMELTAQTFSLSGFGYVGGVTAPLGGPVTNLTPGAYLLGLTADLSRSVESVIPRYAHELINAYALFCAAAILTEKNASPKLSVFTLSNRAFADRMDDKYNADAKRALKVVTRRMLADLCKEAPTPTNASPVVTDRTDLAQIEFGSYV